MLSTISEAKSHYDKAVKLGKKEGGSLQVLDHIFKEIGLHAPTEYPLGIQDIYLEQIVGTRTEGRLNCFSSSFYPILDDVSEFSSKWISLCQAHLDEGIHDPIKVYEFMNLYYVLEGNKRVSVLKYFDAVTITADVIRILPPQIDRPDIKLYYEYIDFYNLSQLNYIYFSRPGSFAKLHRLIGKKRNEIWTDHDREDFASLYTSFRKEYLRLMGKQYYRQICDAFLSFLSVFGYDSLINMSIKDLNRYISKWKVEFPAVRGTEEENGLKMNPTEKKGNPLLQLVAKNSHLKIAFIHDKSSERSGWTFNHDTGRMYLEKVFPENVKTTAYYNTDLSNIDSVLQEAIRDRHQVIFTTSPIFLKASLKAAVDHPEIKFLNCTTHTSYKHIRTYYSRMYEVKFLMGIIAGCMTENQKIGYIADYPIYGTLSNINAFALGAKMVNPRVKVYLKWSRQCRRLDGSQQTIHDIYRDLAEEDIHIICDKDSLSSGEHTQRIGLYRIDRDNIWNMAIPVWDWNVFYEKTVANILNGAWKSEEAQDGRKGISYWWGISSGMVDLIYSGRLPVETSRMVELCKKSITEGRFQPFTGMLYSQDGIVQSDASSTLSPHQVLTMDWLADNIIGRIPETEELNESAQILSAFLGVDKEEHIL